MALARHRASRTQAMPKHSLFGTALENVDKSEIEEISAKEIAKRGQRRPEPERYPIPEHLQAELSGRGMVQNALSELTSQNESLAEASGDLRAKELQALGFQRQAEGRRAPRGRNTPGWLTKQDLENADKINITGLAKHGSYDRDRYGPKPPTHNYSLIGGLLDKGNDFGHPQRFHPDAGLNESENNYMDKLRCGWNPEVDPDVLFPLKKKTTADGGSKPKSAVDLPPNIRHQFGSKECDKLLSDEGKVAETLEKQKRIPGRSAKARLEVDTKDYAAKASGSYFEVGQVTRYNIFPSRTAIPMQSSTQAAHTSEVYMRRAPMVDEYRITKDDYGHWAQMKLCQDKLMKQWDAVAKEKKQS